MLLATVWIAEHQVDLSAALGISGTMGAVGGGVISFFKRPVQSAINALNAVLPGKSALPHEMTATLRKIDKM